MQDLNDVAAEVKAGGKAASGQMGYWVPGGIGQNHKMLKSEVGLCLCV